MYVGHCRSISAVAGILVIILNAPCRAESGPASLMVGDSPVLLRLKSLLLRRGKTWNFTVRPNYSRVESWRSARCSRLVRPNYFLPVESNRMQTALTITLRTSSPFLPTIHSFHLSLPLPHPTLVAPGCLGWPATAGSTTKIMITWASTGCCSTSLARSVGATSVLEWCSETLTIPDQIQAIAEFRLLVDDLHEAGLRLQVRHGHGTSLLVFIHVPRDRLGQMIHKSRSACSVRGG